MLFALYLVFLVDLALGRFDFPGVIPYCVYVCVVLNPTFTFTPSAGVPPHPENDGEPELPEDGRG